MRSCALVCAALAVVLATEVAGLAGSPEKVRGTAPKRFQPDWLDDPLYMTLAPPFDALARQRKLLEGDR
jgi:hypothetical protein